MIKKKPLIGIVGGNGRMGSWFKEFFKNQGFKVIVSDLDTEISNIELAKKADIVIVAVPIGETVKVIKEIRGFVRKKSLLCDITSLKSKPVNMMKKAKSGVLGMHPLFGPLVQRLEGQRIVFCKVRNNYWVDFLKDTFIKNKAKIIETSPKEHDLQMAIIQSLVHFANISLARVLYNQKIVPKSEFLTPVFRLQALILGRILGQSPRLYAEIEIENPYFPKILTDFNRQIKDLTKDVKAKDFKSFIKKFKKSSLYLRDFIKIAETKSTEILKMIDRQPIMIRKLKKRISIKSGAKIGFLGPKGTFSHQAALETFSKKTKFFLFTTTKEVFEAVNDGRIDFGVVPVENTIGGIVSETINGLIEYPLKVTGSLSIPIHHYLLARTKNKNKIKVVKSHKQALSQCGDWLEKNLPGVKLEAVSSTTAPIMETKSQDIGFIASSSAAKEYKLNILARKIESSKDNFTKFYVVSTALNKEIQKKLKSKKTLILFAVYDRVGVLRDILDIFARNNLNLTSLHSIPSRLRPWDYFFFLEVQIPFSSPKLKKILRDIKKNCSIVRVIGSS